MKRWAKGLWEKWYEMMWYSFHTLPWNSKWISSFKYFQPLYFYTSLVRIITDLKKNSFVLLYISGSYHYWFKEKFPTKSWFVSFPKLKTHSSFYSVGERGKQNKKDRKKSLLPYNQNKATWHRPLGCPAKLTEYEACAHTAPGRGGVAAETQLFLLDFIHLWSSRL